MQDRDEGCTLAAYAECKQLPQDFLKGLGVSEFYLDGRPALRIPYRMTDGSEGPIRHRLRLTKGEQDRFRWRNGSKLALYGLWRLADASAAGYVVLDEGESDTQTLWSHGIPALGLPGAASWQEEWAVHFTGIPVIYVVVEPDAGGDGVLRWLAPSGIRDRVRLVRLRDAKDPSDLHVADPSRFKEQFEAALKAAEPWSSFIRAKTTQAESDAWQKCSDLAARPNILTDFADAFERRGVVGERRVAQLVFLAMVSRLLSRPVSLVVKGPSSAGKSHVTRQVLSFFPDSAYYELTGMSERALFYSDVSLKHVTLCVFEAEGMSNPLTSYAVRSLLSEGCLRYETIEKTSAGLKPRRIVREGPTGLIVTTTAPSLHAENETRLLSVRVTDTPQQTRNVLRAMAAAPLPAAGADLDVWKALNEWLTFGPRNVCIPFADRLADKVDVAAVRMRRDFGTILALISAHALLHRASRDRDEEGRIVATLDDYAVVRGLVADLISEGVKAAVNPAVRETVEAVQALDPCGNRSVGMIDVARHLSVHDATVSRRVDAAIAAGYLVNEETRHGHRRARLRIGEPLPDDTVVLPRVEDLVADTVSLVSADGAVATPDTTVDDGGVDHLTASPAADQPFVVEF